MLGGSNHYYVNNHPQSPRSGAGASPPCWPLALSNCGGRGFPDSARRGVHEVSLGTIIMRSILARISVKVKAEKNSRGQEGGSLGERPGFRAAASPVAFVK